MGRIQKLGGIASPLAAIQGRPSPADLVPVLRVPTEPVISLDGFFAFMADAGLPGPSVA